MLAYIAIWFLGTFGIGSLLGVISYFTNDLMSFGEALIAWWILSGGISLLATIFTAIGYRPRQFKI